MSSCAHTGTIDYVGGVGPVCHDCQQHVIMIDGVWVLPPKHGPYSEDPDLVAVAATPTVHHSRTVHRGPFVDPNLEAVAVETIVTDRSAEVSTTPRKGVADPATRESATADG